MHTAPSKKARYHHATPNFQYPLEDEEQFRTIPLETRKICTDWPILLLFIAFCVGMFIISLSTSPPVSLFSVRQHARLFKPTDYLGRVCGVNNEDIEEGVLSLPGNEVCKLFGPHSDACVQQVKQAQVFEDLTNRPYLYYMDITKPFEYGGVCVSYCPGSGPEGSSYCPPELKSLQDVSPTVFEKVCVSPRKDMDETRFFPETLSSQFITNNLQYKSMLYRCVPSISSSPSPKDENATILEEQTSAVTSYLNSASMVVNELWGDVARCWKLILVSSVVAILIGFAFLFFIRFFAAVFVWFAVVAGFMALFGGGVLGLWNYFADRDTTPLSSMYILTYWMPDLTLYGSIFCLVGSVIYAVFIAAFYTRIKRAVAIFREAALGVASLPQLLMLPMLVFGFIAIFLLFWIQVTLSLWSSLGISYVDKYTTHIRWSTSHRFLFMYHLFGYFWIMEFFVAYLYTSVAGAISTWYWTPAEKRYLLLFQQTVARAAARPLLYHMGSLALGSLIVGTIRFLSYIVQKVVKKLENASGNNFFVRCMGYCVKYVLACVTKIITIVTKHAYIQIAIYGKGFFSSSKNAMMLMKRNAAQIAVVEYIGDVILFLAQATISIITTYFASCFMKSPYLVKYDPQNMVELKRSSHFLVLTTIFLCSFVIARVFLVIFETAIDTILQCYLMDMEMSKSSSRPLYVESMKSVIDENKRSTLENTNNYDDDY